MTSIWIKIVSPIFFTAVAVLIFYQPRLDTNDLNSPQNSRILVYPREKNTNEKAKVSGVKTSDGKSTDPNLIIPSETIYDVGDINKMIKAALLIADDEKRCQTLKRIAYLWTLIDPEACLKWSLSIARDGSGYEYITASVISTLVGNNQSEKAIQMLSVIPQGDLRDTAIGYGIWSILDLENPYLTTAGRLLTMISSKNQMDNSVGTISNEFVKANKLHELKEGQFMGNTDKRSQIT